MRLARTLAVLVALSLLARCGNVVLPTRYDPAPLFAAGAEPVRTPVVAVAAEARPVAEAAPVGRTPEPPASVVAKPEALRVERVPSFHEQVRELVSSLHGRARQGGWRAAHAHERAVLALLALGTAAYPAYEAILADPESTHHQIIGVCDVLNRLPGDLGLFVPLIVRRLADPDTSGLDANRDVCARTSLMALLDRLGTERDAWVLVPDLDDANWFIQLAAAAALAKIGGRNELEAMNTWLTGQNHHDFCTVQIRKFRDELELRLLTRP